MNADVSDPAARIGGVASGVSSEEVVGVALTIRNPKVVTPKVLDEQEIEQIRRRAREQVRAEEPTLILRQMRARLAG